MIKSVLVANRGEIARRVFSTCRKLGIATVAVYSDADAEAPHVREADQAVRLGPPPARESYLLGDKVIAAALETGAEAIHPGYGFLSENAEFAEAVAAAGLVWIGPPPSAIRAMGLKDAAKKLMAEAGVPVTPGYLGEDQSDARLQAEADAIGYPLLIKAVAGGGGKGMRKVEASADFAPALGAARREAANAFGDDRVLLETYVTRPRHIEVQVFADTHGNTVHLFERDCSLQRRHQKVIEEAPAPGMDEATRQAVCAAAVRAAQAVNYVGAGTVEFIADASEGLRADRIFFMEMNTRLQVEHPVTEMITGQDLVEWQIRVAGGEPLPKRQDELSIDGWAMEARLYAENPATGFLPSTGPLTRFSLPSDGPRRSGSTAIRVDNAVAKGGEVTPFYDPMIAKIIAHAASRQDAAKTLEEACGDVGVWPVKTNAGFLVGALRHPDFLAGEVDTAFIENRLSDLLPDAAPSEDAIAAAVGAHLAEHFEYGDIDSPWGGMSKASLGFRLNREPERTISVTTAHGRYSATIADKQREEYRHILVLEINGRRKRVAASFGSVHIGRWVSRYFFDDSKLVVFDEGEPYEFYEPDYDHGTAEVGSDQVTAPMPGKIVAVHVSEGATVAKGAPLVTLEAMKMEHVLTAPFDGQVAELAAAAGAQVSEGVALVRLESVDSA